LIDPNGAFELNARVIDAPVYPVSISKPADINNVIIT